MKYAVLTPRFSVHFAPDFRRLTDNVYAYKQEGDKLYGLQWVERVRGAEDFDPIVTDQIDGAAPRDFLQAFVDEAFKLGIVPKQLPDYSGELKATKGWLEDMRVLAKVSKPQPGSKQT